MKINSELPINLLHLNDELNEYDFILHHLYEENKDYAEFYRGRKSFKIFDNSAYEFFVKGEELDCDVFYKNICDLKPNFVLAPDTLMDKEKTIKDTFDFLNKYELPEGTRPLLVAQGKTIEEIKQCVELYLDKQYLNIAIPFHNRCFRDLGVTCEDEEILSVFKAHYNEITEDLEYAIGRIMFLDSIEDLIWKFDHVHMLGSHCPLEKYFYNGLVDTMDTGYPVKCAIAGYDLYKEPRKPNIIIDDFLTESFDEDVIERIKRNVIRFREL